MANRKADLQLWLQERRIDFPQMALKKDLYEIVKRHKPATLYQSDVITYGSGHLILRTPVANCELNAIELIWANVKGYVAQHNTTFRLTDVRTLLETALTKVTRDDWENAVKHTLNVEQSYWERDSIQEAMAPLQVHLGSDSDDSDVTSTAEDDQ